MSRIPLNHAELANQGLKDRLEMSTAEIGLAVRTTNCLEERGIFTVDDLLRCTSDDLLSISNFGEKTLEEVYNALEKIGFHRPHRAPGRPAALSRAGSANRPSMQAPGCEGYSIACRPNGPELREPRPAAWAAD